MPVPPKPFYMIRHGQTEANASKYMAGSLDSPLTELGIQQADIARLQVEALTVKPTVIIHSHLSRARDTASIINQNLKLDMIEDPDYAEMHAGDWEGAPWADCVEMFDGWIDPPNGEKSQDFINRVKRAKNRALSLKDTPALIVCHGGVFRAFGKLYNLEMWGVENCRLHRFTPDRTNVSFPWTAHSFHMEDILREQLSEVFHPHKPKVTD